jgi:collagen type III alpha
VQRMFAPFYKLGGGLGGVHRGDTPGGDGMGRNLISPAPEAAPAVGVAVAVAAAASHDRDPQSQPDMRQAGYLHPLVVPGAAARQARDSNRISVFTNNSASTGFIPSPVSPLSPASMLSPGIVRTSRPIQAQPDPRVHAPATAHVSRGSVSTISDTSGISAGLSPGQMTWPMPPGTPPAIQTPDGPQYLNFQQSGQTVVRISQPSRSNRRSGGY